MTKLAQGEETSFLDILFSMLLFFIALFTLVIINVNDKKTESKNTSSKSDIVITVSWPKDINADVDTHLEDPVGNRVWYGQKDKGLMHLDRDDVGEEFVQLDKEQIDYKDNREITSIRGMIPGEYILNIHAFTLRDNKDVPVSIEIEQMNPLVKIVFSKEVILNDSGDEITVTRFTITNDFLINNFNDLPKEMVRKTKF